MRAETRRRHSHLSLLLHLIPNRILDRAAIEFRELLKFIETISLVTK